jgi:hypothetical protein
MVQRLMMVEFLGKGETIRHYGEVEPPDSVASWAALVVLERKGIAAAAAAAAAAAGPEWRIRYERAPRWFRANLLELGDALGLTDAQVDEMLLEAADVEAAG